MTLPGPAQAGRNLLDGELAQGELGENRCSVGFLHGRETTVGRPMTADGGWGEAASRVAIAASGFRGTPLNEPRIGPRWNPASHASRS
jgi:hypothetical protein